MVSLINQKFNKEDYQSVKNETLEDDFDSDEYRELIRIHTEHNEAS